MFKSPKSLLTMLFYEKRKLHVSNIQCCRIKNPVSKGRNGMMARKYLTKVRLKPSRADTFLIGHLYPANSFLWWAFHVPGITKTLGVL